METYKVFENFPKFDLDDEFALREIKPENDGSNYFYYMNHPKVKHNVSEGNVPESIENAKRDLRYWASFFTTKKGFYWAIIKKDTNQMVGTAGFNNVSFLHKKCEISYDLSYEFWGKGIMSKAIKQIIEFARSKLMLVRVQAYTEVTNKRSIKLLQRCKFKQEGVMKKNEMLRGKHIDSVLFAITF